MSRNSSALARAAALVHWNALLVWVCAVPQLVPHFWQESCDVSFRIPVLGNMQMQSQAYQDSLADPL
jgi:hypothetical protein